MNDQVWDNYAEQLAKLEGLIAGIKVLRTDDMTQSYGMSGTIPDFYPHEISILQKNIQNKANANFNDDNAIFVGGAKYVLQHTHNHKGNSSTIFFTEKEENDNITSSHRKQQLAVFVSSDITVIMLAQLGFQHNFYQNANTGIQKELDNLSSHLEIMKEK